MFKLLGGNHRKRLDKALGDYALPSFPGVVMRVLERLRDPAASTADIVEILELDPGLSVQVLATANSAAYAPRRPIENLAQAVGMLGSTNLESLVMAVAVEKALPRPTCAGFDATRFWRTAARRAATARGLAGLLHPATRSEAFTAALLQDMAIPLLAASRPRQYGPVLERWHARDGGLAELERAALGFDHAEMATWLCAEWSLPDELAAAIGAHHAPAGTTPDCPAAVSLAALLHESETGDPDPLIAAASAYGLAEDAVAELVATAFADAEELATLFT